MPSEIKHKKQFESNKLLLQNSVFDIDKTKHSDWLMTVTFYTAIHLVESVFAKTPYDSKNHGERENNMYRNPKLKQVTTQYITLRNQSRLARYECCKFQKKDLVNAMKCLSDIEKAVKDKSC